MEPVRSKARLSTALWLVVLVVPACKCDADGARTSRETPPVVASQPAAVPPRDIASKDILARPADPGPVFIKDVLVSWKGLEVYGTSKSTQDPRGASRTNEQAATLAQKLLGELQKNPSSIEDMVVSQSEDPRAQSGDPFEIGQDTKFTPEIKALALRLKEHEAGIAMTVFGYHVIERVVPQPDPLESHDILARTYVEKRLVYVQYVLIGWKGAWTGARGATRSKAEADALAKDVLAKMRAGAEMPPLMKQYSEDLNSKDDGHVYEVSPGAALIQPFKNLALRLQVGEAGIVRSPYGFHVIKRIPPPTPDKLETIAIMQRVDAADHVKIKQILLGWKDLNSGDPRGENRTHEELEQLVPATLARLAHGENIDALMKELSEEPNSAGTGGSYDVTPDANVHEPLKIMSLRLKLGEVGVVKTRLGLHIVQRIE